MPPRAVFPRSPVGRGDEIAQGCPNNFAWGGMCVRGKICLAAGGPFDGGAEEAPYQDCPVRPTLPPGEGANGDPVHFQPGTTCTDRSLTHQRSCCYEYNVSCAR